MAKSEKRTYEGLLASRYAAGHPNGEVVIKVEGGKYTTDDPAEQEVLESVFGLKPSKATSEKAEGGN